jgi:hypothetical protein
MKSKIISVFITTVLSTIGLCSTISYAADKEFIIKTVDYNTSNINYKKVVKLFGQNAYQTNTLNINTFDKILNRPLLNFPSYIAEDYPPTQKFNKKNEIFELGTIFNDKLQQILSKLSLNGAEQNKNNFINRDESKDNNSINCTSKKY